MEKLYAIDSEIQKKNYEHELQLCQNAGGDIERYRRLSFDVLQLEQIRLGLEAGIDVESYLEPKMNWMEMEVKRLTLETGIDMQPYLERGFDWLQCAEIRKGLMQHLDVSRYAHVYFLSAQMREIRVGLERGIPVDVYAKQQYDWFQMQEIRKGLEEHVEVQKYSNPDFQYSTMRAIRRGMKQNIDLLPYAQKGYQGKVLNEICRGIALGNDISSYIDKGYDSEQLKQINNAFELNVNIVPYLYPEFHGAQLQEIIKGLQARLDVSVYAKKEFNWIQMRELRHGLQEQVDITQYANPEFSIRQMQEIHKGLLSGVDVSKYAKVYYEPEQMEKMRLELENEETVLSVEMEELLRNTLTEGFPDEELQKTTKELNRDFLLDSCVMITEDKMKVYINFSSVKNMMEAELDKLEVSDIMRLLKHHDVKQGIRKEQIQMLLEHKLYEEDIIVAEGKPSMDGSDGKFTYFFRRDLKRKPKVLEDGSVDYKSMELFEAVEKEQLIAQYQNATRGTFGYDVTGKLILPKKGKELPPFRGQGFRMTEDRKEYYAMLSGIIELDEEKRTLNIRNLYTVPGDVDASTGNINFNGDVNVIGNVESGFSVTATGNVVVDGHCEGGRIYAGSDIVIRKGCQGQGMGEIRAAGNVTGQFFESTVIHAGCNVEASYLLNCQVKAGGKLIVEGRKGVILGGYICAKQGVNCYGIGNIAEIKTVVETGIDKEDMMNYQELAKTLEKVEAEIKTCEDALHKFMEQPNRDEKITALCERLTRAVYTQKSKRKELLREQEEKREQMTKQKGARIAVTGRVYPGAILYLNDEPFKIQDIYTNVEFVKKDNKVDLIPR